MKKSMKHLVAFFVGASIFLQSFGLSVHAQTDGEMLTSGYVSGMLKDKEDHGKKGALTSIPIDLPQNLNTDNANDIAGGTVADVVTFFDHKGQVNVAYVDENVSDDFYDDTINVQRFDANLELIDMLSFPLDLYYLGNVICDENGYYYVVLGDFDAGKENCETIIVKKYDYQGQYVKECGVKGESMKSTAVLLSGTYDAFSGGNCSVAINNGVLACNFGRRMYNEHQSNYVLYFDCDTMERKLVGTVPYVSHSFDQRVVGTSEGGFLVVNKGDMFPRAFTLDVIGAKYLTSERDIELFHFREGPNKPFGYNQVYAELGGIIETDKYYVFCGSSERELSMDFASYNRGNGHAEVRDLFIQVIDKEFEDCTSSEDYFGWEEMRLPTGEAPEKPTDSNIKLGLWGDEVDFVTWLTEYDDPYYAANPKIVAISNTDFVVMWEMRSYGNLLGAQVYYAVIDEDGNVIQNPIPLKGCKLAGRTDPICRDGYIYWTTCDDNGANIYCFDVNGEKTDWISVAGMSITESMDLYVDETKSLEVTILPSNATDKTVKYISGDTNVVTVDENGRLTGIAEGTAIVTAISKDNGTAFDVCEVSVTQPVKELNLGITNVKMTVGESSSYTVWVEPWDATNQTLEWSNSDESVVELTVYDKYYEIKALAEGTTTLTVKATDGSGCMDTATITVTKESIDDSDDGNGGGNSDEDGSGNNPGNDDDDDIFVPGNYVAYMGVTCDYTMKLGDTQQIQFEYEMSDGSKMEFVFSSTDTNIITVDSNRVVTAEGLGTAQIIIKRADTLEAVNEISITVTETGTENDIYEYPYFIYVDVKNAPSNLYMGENAEFEIVYEMSDGTEQRFNCLSSDWGVAGVANGGTYGSVWAEGVGSTVISVQSQSTGEIVYEFTVTVIEKEDGSGSDESVGSTPWNGWYEINGANYWYEEGIRQGYAPDNALYRGKEIYDPDSNAWYWLDNVQSGAKAVGKDVYQESLAGDWGDYIGEDGKRYGKWVRYDEKGHMIKGWQYTESGTYFFDLTYGTMAKGYATIEGVEYYFSPVTGILEQTIGWVPQYGWKTIDGKDYWYENYVRQGVSADGSYRGKEIYDEASGAWYWLDNVQAGAKAVSKDVYQESLAGDWGDYIGADGQCYGKWVRYDENGHMIKGWQYTENGTYFFDNTYGTMAKGDAVIDGCTYYFDENTGALR